MASLKKIVGRTFASLATAGMLLPQAASAKGPGGESIHISSQPRVAATSNYVMPTISHSNGLASDKIQPLSINSGVTGSVPTTGGGHRHPSSPVASTTTGSTVTKRSELKSPWD